MKKNLLLNILIAVNVLVVVIGISAMSMVVMAAPVSPTEPPLNDDPGICIPTWTPTPFGTPYITPPPIGGGGVPPTLTPPPIGGGGPTETPFPTRRK